MNTDGHESVRFVDFQLLCIEIASKKPLTEIGHSIIRSINSLQ